MTSRSTRQKKRNTFASVVDRNGGKGGTSNSEKRVKLEGTSTGVEAAGASLATPARHVFTSASSSVRVPADSPAVFDTESPMQEAQRMSSLYVSDENVESADAPSVPGALLLNTSPSLPLAVGRSHGSASASAAGKDVVAPSAAGGNSQSLTLTDEVVQQQDILLKAISTMQRDVRMLVKQSEDNVTASMKKVLKEMKEMRSTIQSSQDELNALTVSFVSHIGEGDGKLKLDVILAPIRNIFSGSFYRIAFSVCWCAHVAGHVGSMLDDVDKNYYPVVTEMVGLVQGLLYAQQVSKKRTDEMFDKEDAEEHCKFRKSMNTFIITIAQRTDSVGEYTLHYKNGVAKVDKPYWLRQSFILPRHVTQVVDRDVKLSKKISDSVGKKKTSGDITELDVSPPDRDTVAADAARRINQQLTWYLNRCREKVRDAFFERLGFLLVDEASVNIKNLSETPLKLKMCDIPAAKTNLGPAVPAYVSESNSKYWSEIVDSTFSDFSCFVEYDVTVNNEKQEGAVKKLGRTMHMLNIALPLCLRFTGNVRAEEYFALHKDSFRVVVLFGIMLREMLIQKISSFKGQDTTGGMDKVIKLLCPSGKETRAEERKRVLTMTTSAYEDLNEEVVCDDDQDNGDGDSDSDSRNDAYGGYAGSDGEVEDTAMKEVQDFAENMALSFKNA